MPKRIDLTGQRFGRLTVIRKTDQRQNQCVVWECLCDCGNVCFVSSDQLMRKGSGKKRSCGCLQKELHKAYIHGDYQSLLYRKWKEPEPKAE